MAEPVHYGFPGTINAKAQASWLPKVGAARFGVRGATDLQVVRNTSLDRGISILGGDIYGDAVLSVYDPTVPAAVIGLPAPSSGTSRWHMVVARRDWQNPYTVAFPTIDAGPSLPARLPAWQNNPGVTSDQPLALVEVIAGQSAVGQIIDLRCWAAAGGYLIKDAHALDYLKELGAVARLGGTTYTCQLLTGDVVDWVSSMVPVVQAGKMLFNIAASASSLTKTVTFPKPFAAAPIVTATLASNVAGNASQLLVSAYGETTTGCTLKIQTNDNTSIGTTYNINVNWTAVQP